MNYRLVRFFDYNIGKMMAGVLGAFKRRNRKPKHKPRKILLIRFWGIGSIIKSTPAVRAIRKGFPEAEIVFLTMSKNRGLYDNSGLFDRIIYYDMETVSGIITGTIGLISSLRKEMFDIAVDMEFFSRYSAIVAYFSGALVKVGFNTKGQGRERLYDMSARLVEVENRILTFCRLPKLLGIKVRDYSLEPVRFDDNDRRKVDDIIRKSGIKKRSRLIVINPNAGDFALERLWPADRYARIADMAAGKLKAGVIFTGGPADTARVAHVIGLAKGQYLNIAGKTNLRQLAYLLTRTSVFITNDSGPMHIGFAMKTPTVALFGPDTPLRYGPLDTDNSTVLYKKTRCSPCIKTANQNLIRCRFNQRCMRDITVDEVFSAVKRLLR